MKKLTFDVMSGVIAILFIAYFGVCLANSARAVKKCFTTESTILVQTGLGLACIKPE